MVMGVGVVHACEGALLNARKLMCGEVSLVCHVIFGWMSSHWAVGENVALCCVSLCFMCPVVSF